MRGTIDDVEAPLHPALNQGVGAAHAQGSAGEAPVPELSETLVHLDERLSHTAYVAGDALTVADLRMIVTLLRFDAQSNADGLLGPRLETYPHLWD